MKTLIRAILPERTLDTYRRFRSRELIEELRKLRPSGSGADGGLAWITLDSGTTFTGLLPTPGEAILYRALAKDIPHLPVDTFGVALEIVSRYLVPRSIPGMTVYEPSTFEPLRDPIHDFDFSADERATVAERFRPISGETIFDIGAYHGFGTLRLAEMVGPSGKVVAFESDPTVLPVLERNLEANKSLPIQLDKRAVGQSTGTATFYSREGTINSLRSDVLDNLGYTTGKEHSVETISVDDILDSIDAQRLDMINLTINGGEVEAIRGMSRILGSGLPLRITLAGWYQRDGHRICDILAPEISRYGFEVRTGRLGRLLAWRN